MIVLMSSHFLAPSCSCLRIASPVMLLNRSSGGKKLPSYGACPVEEAVVVAIQCFVVEPWTIIALDGLTDFRLLLDLRTGRPKLEADNHCSYFGF
ncbi:unnamed protein product [Ilex paraguariensis]|uniref:Uncharacterized protein n=1 Tax=Ilex paraguariensis TaxID=185542 RepID=A0ABC8TBT5_9AQUA